MNNSLISKIYFTQQVCDVFNFQNLLLAEATFLSIRFTQKILTEMVIVIDVSRLYVYVVGIINICFSNKTKSRFS